MTNEPTTVPTDKYTYDPEQAVDLAINVLQHMRVQQGNELAAVNASLAIMIDAAAWLTVRASATQAAAVEAAAAFADTYRARVTLLEKARDGAGAELPPPAEASYADPPPGKKRLTHEELQETCLALAPVLNSSLNDLYLTRVGFVLAIFEYGAPGTALAFAANAEPDDLKAALVELTGKLDQVGRVVSVPR